MAAHMKIANEFFQACESGKGEDECRKYHLPGATFSCDALPDISTLAAYTDWMKALFGFIPDARYTLNSVTSSEHDVVFVATFQGTHTGEGGPCPPTGKAMTSVYVYVITFNGEGKITKMTKVWNGPNAFKQLGWA